MSTVLKLSAPVTSRIPHVDPHAGQTDVVRCGAIWQSGHSKAEVRHIVVMSDTNDQLLEEGLLSVETPSVYDNAACLVQEHTQGTVVDYVSISKAQLPAAVSTVHVFIYSLYGGMFAPFDSLNGELCYNVQGTKLRDDHRMPSGFTNFKGCTAVLGVRMARADGRWIQSLESSPVHMPLFLAALGVTLTP